MNPTLVNPYQSMVNPQFYNQFQMQQPQMRSNRIYAQGEAGAKGYLVSPNTSVDIWDSEAHTIYVKTADASGIPYMQILDYTIRGSDSENKPQEAESPKYASADEVNALKSEIEAIKEQLKHTPQQKSTKKVVEDE